MSWSGPMSEIEAALSRLARQDQFLDVVDREEAIARFHRHLNLRPIGSERSLRLGFMFGI